jgi:hypothetical protein
MAAVHVFAIDWVPSKDDKASGGGLRSLQIIEALRDAGHRVTFSVPVNCRHVRHQGRDSAELRAVLIHDQNNQIDILRETRPDAVFWLPTLIRDIPFTGLGDMVQVCDLIGLPHIEAAMGSPVQASKIRDKLVGFCGGADLVLTGSEEQHGYWLAELSRAGGESATAVVPYALPLSLRHEGATGAARLTRLHVTGMVYAWSTSVALMQCAANWVARRNDVTLSAIVGTDPGGATDRAVLRALNAIGSTQNVEMPGEMSFSRAMSEYRAGSVALDLYEANLERRLAVPIRAVNALAHGVPVLSTVESTLTRRLQAAGAGIVAEAGAGNAAERDTGTNLEAALDQLAAMPAKQLGGMARAARAFAAREYDAETIAKTLCSALDAALRRRADRRRRWYAGSPREDRLGHVLVMTDESVNMRELRVDIPFAAMHRHLLIAGYSIWSKNEFTFSTGSRPARQDFHAIWVQRNARPAEAIALRSLNRPFAYDLDDNLLTSPAYRQPFSIELQQTVRNLLWSCAVLSCSTARLAQKLQRPALEHLIGKVVVTPNLLREPPGPRPVGSPRVLLWASSDTPALTHSHLAVCKALRDFCLTHQLTLVFLGAAPPDLLVESDVPIEHIGAASYGSYQTLVRSFAPAIMACPLETDCDEATRDFIDSKSDIKILEAFAAGVVGVFSRAPPYQDTDLPGAILCENTYAGWFEGLSTALRQCTRDTTPATLPPERYASPIGVRPWFEALQRVQLTEPLPASAFRDAVRMMRARYGRRLLSELEFDGAFYLSTYPDVQDAIEEGNVASPFAHYERNGFREGRLGRPDDIVEPHNEEVWSNLGNTLSDLRQSVDSQAQRLDALKTRRAARLRLRKSE